MVRSVDQQPPATGVSPAYFISRFGDRFSARQVAEALVDIAALGCRGFQLEVYHPENLDHWRAEGARQVRKQSHDLNLSATQFVAHFMMASFSDAAHLNSDAAFGQMSGVLEIVSHFDECRLITIPVGPFEADAMLTAEDHLRWMERLMIKMRRLLEMAATAGRRLALEVIPGGLIAGTDGFLRLCDQLGSETLGFNFDTGHAWAAKENIYLLPAKLGNRIAGTHLCDNFGHENLSLRPGAGSIDWPRMINALVAAGYQGSYDLEIICPSRKVQSEYQTGIIAIDKLLRPNAAAA